MTVKETLKYAKKGGVRIFGQVSLSDNDMVMVQLVKESFINKISAWPEDEEIFADIRKNGDLVIN